jgi:hypothetical protein
VKGVPVDLKARIRGHGGPATVEYDKEGDGRFYFFMWEDSLQQALSKWLVGFSLI